ncbi:hypothetical protein Poly30_48190 [Planctomycetes bacterium Poly30]|uniref:Uncharacterized protein n=2 Tax=Saltatorellus ferox TaxID=2528018 RepID=A0A518EYU8_9BACT|nr:hypothetical protein Poly30_48190 [Planctomycetes bacterium Poly30]
MYVCVAPVLLLAGASAAAQSSVTHTPADALPNVRSEPVAQVQYVEDEGRLWARGATYKASAGSDGFTYFPYLGSRAARNYPVQFRLRSARLDGQPLSLTEDARVKRDGDRIVLDRGAVRGIYDLSLDSVEQSFAVDAAGSHGALVLTLDVDTDLAAEAAGGGFEWIGPEGGVAYGAATVLDASGRTAPAPMTLRDGQLEVTVAAEFLASAVGEIVIDPVIRTFLVGAGSATELEPDVAYDATTERFMYVYEVFFSSTDTDIFYRTFDVDGVQDDTGWLFLSNTTTEDPEVANLNAANKCYCVCTGRLGSTRILQGRMRDMVTGVLDPIFPVDQSFTGAWDAFGADIGGNGTSNPAGTFLIGWTREFAAGFSRPVFRTVSSTGFLGPIFEVETSNSSLMDQVAISKSVGDGGAVDRWNVAYRQESLTTGDVELRGVQISGNGSILSQPNTLHSFPSGIDCVDIDVSDAIVKPGIDPTYVVVYDEVSSADTDIWILACRNNVRRNRVHLQALEHGQIERTQIEPRVTTTRDEFVVSYLEREATGLGFSVYLTSLDLVEDEQFAISENRTLVGSTGALWSGGCAMVSRFAGGLVSSRFLGLAWAEFGPASGAMGWDINGAIYAVGGPDAVGIQNPTCIGTVNSSGERAFMAAYGDASIDQPKTLVATRLPADSFGYFAVGSMAANVPGAGGSQGTLCIAGAVGRYSNFVASSGPEGRIALVINPTSLPTPSGSEAVMSGTIRFFQLWTRDSFQGTPTSNFTNSVAVVFR